MKFETVKTNTTIQFKRRRQTAFGGWWLACFLSGLLALCSPASARDKELEKIQMTTEQAYVFAYQRISICQP